MLHFGHYFTGNDITAGQKVISGLFVDRSAFSGDEALIHLTFSIQDYSICADLIPLLQLCDISQKNILDLNILNLAIPQDMRLWGRKER